MNDVPEGASTPPQPAGEPPLPGEPAAAAAATEAAIDPVPAVDPAESSRRQRAGLRHMRIVATSLLAFMALVFAATWMVPPSTLTGYVRAFAEAAMVGALADWFAVTALFRHPLGLPIPHTAIVPRRKDQIGDALATFVREHFLAREVLAPRLQQIDFAELAADWLARPENARRLGSDAALLLDRILAALDDGELQALLQNNLTVGMRRTRVAPLLGEALDMLFRAEREQELMNAGIRLLHDYLRDNKTAIHRRIVEETPWWLPNIVDREIYRRLVGELERFLERARSDPDNPDRARFNRGVRDLIVRLKEDPELGATAERIKRDLIEDPAVQTFFASLWTQVRGYVKRETNRPNSRLARRLSDSLGKLADSLRYREHTREELNRWLGDAILHVMDHYRADMSRLISETVRSWDAHEAAGNIERYVGRDLQFIRINGTLVGGLAGLAIHGLLHLSGRV
jgi:uncharacterized membrane-anchored protein YjiN (DUF445 family)